MPASKLNAALAKSPTLTADQVGLVRALTRSGHGIENVEAGAGAGKTFALRVAVDAFTAAGHPVLGTSTSNLACRTLEAEAGVRAVNTTRLLADLDRGNGLPPETVLLVDEAGMVGTRTYHRLAEHVTAAGGKLIGIGDSRQLAEIQAGGAFRAISDRFGAVALAGNRRQLDPEEIRALAALRDGDVHAYVLFEHQHGRLTVADDPAQAMRTQLADWWQATQREPDHDAVLVALRRSSVAELNANAHALMRSAGRLGEDEVVAAGGTFAAGDRVLLLRNTATLDVDNGDRGTVITADPHERALAVELDGGRQVRLPDWYLDAGWVDYGYALTAHKLQSTTVDRTFALATEGLYQEAGYSIATRARHETHFYLVAHPDLAHEPMHGPPQPPADAIARFARHLSESRAQSLATDEPARAHARALPTAALQEEHEQLRQALNAFPDRQARALERLNADADRQREELANIDTRIGQTAHQLDTLGFLSRHGREGDELRRETRRLDSDRTYVQGLYRETVREMAAQRSEDDPASWIDRHADQIRHLRALEAELAARDRHGERQRIAAVQIDPPDHITAVLGPRPESYLTRPVWERAVAAIETYRHRHHIAPDHHRSALGPPPRGVHANLDVATVERAVAQARSELHLDTHEPDRRSLADRLVDPPKLEHDRGIGIEI